MNQFSFQECKARVSIIQVALELGYKFDKTKGLNQPSFVLLDQTGTVTDRIYIKNPKVNNMQGYWRRAMVGKNSGDLISFVKENLSSFPETASARNEVDALNKVLNRFAGNPLSSDEMMKNFESTVKIWSVKNFDINRYERTKNDFARLFSFLQKRNITEETGRLFSPFLEIIKDKESKFDYRNLAFPYTRPGQNEIVGFEIRGYGGFKGKAEGSNSSSALWIADFSKNNPAAVRNIYFTESGYDTMAYYQINKSNLNLESSVFVSTGGSFSEKQLTDLLANYPQAKPVLAFDNDLHGRMYDIIAFCLLKEKKLSTSMNGDSVIFSLENKNFSVPIDELTFSRFLSESGLRNNQTILLAKAPKQYKDWNEVLMNKQADQKVSNKYDYISDKRDNNTIKFSR